MFDAKRSGIVVPEFCLAVPPQGLRRLRSAQPGFGR